MLRLRGNRGYEGKRMIIAVNKHGVQGQETTGRPSQYQCRRDDCRQLAILTYLSSQPGFQEPVRWTAYSGAYPKQSIVITWATGGFLGSYRVWPATMMRAVFNCVRCEADLIEREIACTVLVLGPLSGVMPPSRERVLIHWLVLSSTSDVWER